VIFGRTSLERHFVFNIADCIERFTGERPNHGTKWLPKLIAAIAVIDREIRPGAIQSALRPPDTACGKPLDHPGTARHVWPVDDPPKSCYLSKSLCRDHRHRQLDGVPLIGQLVRHRGKFKRNSPHQILADTVTSSLHTELIPLACENATTGWCLEHYL